MQHQYSDQMGTVDYNRLAKMTDEELREEMVRFEGAGRASNIGGSWVPNQQRVLFRQLMEYAVRDEMAKRGL